MAAGNIPDDCVPTSGVAFAVTAADGSAVGSCSTDDTGLCIVRVPNEAIVTVTEDTTTSPAGTAPRENPITTQAVTEFAGALFINLPTGGETPTQVPAEPTTPVELPNTGAGPRQPLPIVGWGWCSWWSPRPQPAERSAWRFVANLHRDQPSDDARRLVPSQVRRMKRPAGGNSGRALPVCGAP